MNIRLKTVILECSDIPQLLSFYTGLLDWPVVYEQETFVGIHSNDEEMGIAFQYDENYIPPVWPSQLGHQQMMVHLDFAVADKQNYFLSQSLHRFIKLPSHFPGILILVKRPITLLNKLFFILQPAGFPRSCRLLHFYQAINSFIEYYI